MPTILHLTAAEAWAEAVARGEYRGDTLATEGFIHCSTPAQIEAVANRWFPGRAGLVLLHIDPDRVRSEIRYEVVAHDHAPFPHIHGPLNADAVVAVEPFEPGPDGVFRIP